MRSWTRSIAEYPLMRRDAGAVRKTDPPDERTFVGLLNVHRHLQMVRISCLMTALERGMTRMKVKEMMMRMMRMEVMRMRKALMVIHACQSSCKAIPTCIRCNMKSLRTQQHNIRTGRWNGNKCLQNTHSFYRYGTSQDVNPVA